MRHVTGWSLLVVLLISGEARAEPFLTLPLRTAARMTCDFCCYRFRGGSCHGGIDYGMRNGTEIIAAASGTVEKVVNIYPSVPNRQGGYGNYVRILHPNGYRTIYAHLTQDSIAVTEGETVRVGQVIAFSDNSGASTGPHLHFEVRDPSGRKVDPYGESPSYPNCGANPLWVICPPLSPAEVDQDRDGWNMLEDCDDNNPTIHPLLAGEDESLCNNVDDDCDGLTDERWAFLGETCTVEPIPGCVRDGTWVCSEDETTIICNADSHVGTELCNSIDDDCDTEIDEDWRTGLATDLGEPCEVGIGECHRTGVFECEPFGRGVVCGADYVHGTPEICDGLDNNCDGETDNYCTCQASRPHPNCLCRECDISCPVPSDKCLVVGLNPDGTIVHTCEYSYGCYFCGSRPGTEGRTCVYCMNCTGVCAEFCLNPAYLFCSDYCPL